MERLGLGVCMRVAGRTTPGRLNGVGHVTGRTSGRGNKQFIVSTVKNLRS